MVGTLAAAVRQEGVATLYVAGDPDLEVSYTVWMKEMGLGEEDQDMARMEGLEQAEDEEDENDDDGEGSDDEDDFREVDLGYIGSEEEEDEDEDEDATGLSDAEES